MQVITSEEAAGSTGNVTHGVSPPHTIWTLLLTQPMFSRLQASKSHPHYLIKNDNTGKETAYKAENVVGTI